MKLFLSGPWEENLTLRGVPDSDQTLKKDPTIEGLVDDKPGAFTEPWTCGCSVKSALVTFFVPTSDSRPFPEMKSKTPRPSCVRGENCLIWMVAVGGKVWCCRHRGWGGAFATDSIPSEFVMIETTISDSTSGLPSLSASRSRWLRSGMR